MQKFILFFSLIVFSSFSLLKAQQPAVITNSKPGWHKIAEKTVDFRTDRDDIVLVGADRFKAIQLKVTDAHIHIEDMDVSYDLPNMQEKLKEDIQVRKDFTTGARSRIIYLQYSCLKIHDISFAYRTVLNWKFQKAHIEVYGLK